MRKKIGEFLVGKGVLTEKQVEQILHYGHQNGLRFGEAGLELGILTQDSLIKAFGPNFKVDFFHLVPEYFPQVTRDLLPVETVVRFGVLPLGYKTVPKMFRARKQLNLGLLDPSRRDVLDVVEDIAKAKVGADFAGIKPFLILAEEFVTVLREVYQLTPESLAQKPEEQVDDTLKLFLETT